MIEPCAFVLVDNFLCVFLYLLFYIFGGCFFTLLSMSYRRNYEKKRVNYEKKRVNYEKKRVNYEKKRVNYEKYLIAHYLLTIITK